MVADPGGDDPDSDPTVKKKPYPDPQPWFTSNSVNCQQDQHVPSTKYCNAINYKVLLILYKLEEGDNIENNDISI